MRKSLLVMLVSLSFASHYYHCTASAIAAETQKQILAFSEKDLPEYCKLPVVVPDRLTAKEYFDLAVDYADWQLPIQARQCLDKLEKMNPDSQMQAKIKRLVDTRLPKQIPPVEAVVLNLRAGKLPPMDADLKNLMTGKSDGKRYAKAIELCNQCIQKFPNFEYAYLTLANYRALEDNHSISIEMYQKALKINPHNTKALVAMGDQLLWTNQFKDAKAAFALALNLDPDDIMAKERLKSVPDHEKAANPLARLGTFITGTVGMFMLPGALATRDAAALDTSGFIDKKGKFLFHRLNTTALGHAFSNGLWFNYNHFEDKTGKTIGKQEFYRAEDFSEGLAAVCFKEKWGYLNASGGYAINPQYQDARSFREGLVPVKSAGRWGYIDKTGKWIVPPKFQGALSFYDGLAAVVSNGKVGYIDHSGKLVIAPKYDVGKAFSDGLAIVTAFETPIKRHHDFCIDKSGKVVFDLTALLQKLQNTTEAISSGDVFVHCSFPDVLVADKCDKPRMFSTNAPLPDRGRFSDGLLLISVGKRYGYVNQAGKLAIPCKFGSADPFLEGLAPVSLDEEEDFHSGIQKDRSYGYIDKTGKFVIPPKFKYASQFHEGLAHVMDKQRGGGFIDRTGRLAIPVAGGWASDFSDGVAAVGEEMVYP